eukprot:COSAG02_NODE_15022_length_1212_cov_1.339623_1_plen_171_part_00
MASARTLSYERCSRCCAGGVAGASLLIFWSLAYGLITVEDGITENSISSILTVSARQLRPPLQYSTFIPTYYLHITSTTRSWILSTVVSPRSGKIAVLNVPPVLSNSVFHGNATLSFIHTRTPYRLPPVYRYELRSTHTGTHIGTRGRGAGGGRAGLRGWRQCCCDCCCC